MTDKLTRFLFDNHSVRGEIVQLEDSFQQILAASQYPEIIGNLLGELMAACSLLTATLKFEGEITLQLQGEGYVKYAVIHGTHNQALKGVARWDKELTDPPSEFSKMFEKGFLAITITPKEGERYQGIVALDKDNLGACLESYFEQSEQLPTKVVLFADAGQSRKAGGILLQIIPTSSETSSAEENPSFQHLSVLANTLTSDELLHLSDLDILHRLYHEEEVRLVGEKEVSFRCDCSKARSAVALRNIDKVELLNIVEEDGAVRMNCQFCHTEYLFDSFDIESIHNDSYDFSDTAKDSKH